jgi:hypothetical protein
MRAGSIKADLRDSNEADISTDEQHIAAQEGGYQTGGLGW